MKKSLYLKLSQQETNKRIQLSLVERYKHIRQKSSLLGWLYFIVAYVSFSLVAIVSFIYRWIMISKDFRFTPHYLQTVIDYNKMGVEQANQYLNVQLSKYNKSRSYGNFSLAQRDAINVTFELLLEKYKLPEPIDNKHLDVISGLLEVKALSVESSEKIDKASSAMVEQTNEITQSIIQTYNVVTETSNKIDELSSKQEVIISGISDSQEQLGSISDEITSVKSTLEPITSYTEQKQKQEQSEQERENELRVKQEKRKTLAHNREKGRKLDSFESALSDGQIAVLTAYCNKVAVFDRDVEVREMKDLLLCLHKKPLRLTVNKYLALLFTELQQNKLICKNWKSVAVNHNCFVSSENKFLTSNDLYMANQTSGLIDPIIYDLIMECVEEILQL
jgi:hypothetical protein